MATTQNQKTLKPEKSWFLLVAAAFVVLTFAFVIVPYMDPKRSAEPTQELPAFDLPLLGPDEGARLRSTDLGGKLLLLDFWASWCQPCREQTKLLVNVAGELGQRVRIVGVATSEARAQSSAYLASHPTPFENLYDENGELSSALSVSGLPTLVLVGQNGQIVSRTTGGIDRNELFLMVEGSKR